jgi:hypothetical protein
MTDHRTGPDAGNGTTSVPASSAHPGLPRWVKVSGIVVAILAAVVVVIMLVVGGEHGPGRHGGVGSHAAEPLAPHIAVPQTSEGIGAAGRPAR